MATINVEQARYNMIEQQIRPCEVLDQAVLDTLARVRREDYVPEAYKNLAFADTALPIGAGEVMMPPRLEGKMLQALTLAPQDTVLEIGTGSGHFTALLASLARHVYSVDINNTLLETARQTLKNNGVYNVSLELGDAAHGWDQHAPYDVIVLTGSLPVLPNSFQQALKIGGRLCAIVGDSPVMMVKLITRVSESQWHSEDLFETDLPALKNAPQPNRFKL